MNALSAKDVAELNRGGMFYGKHYNDANDFARLWKQEFNREPTNQDIIDMNAVLQQVKIGNSNSSQLLMNNSAVSATIQTGKTVDNIGAQFPATTRKGRSVNEMFLTWCNLVANTPSELVPDLWAQAFKDRPFPTTDWIPVDGAVLCHPAAPEWIFTGHVSQRYWDGKAPAPELGYKLRAKGPFKGVFDKQRFGATITGDYEFFVEDKNPAIAMARVALVVREYVEPL
jgi:hypothetical protein